MFFKFKRMRDLANFKVIQSACLKGALLFWLLFSETKNCKHNKCMGIYDNLAAPRNI